MSKTHAFFIVALGLTGWLAPVAVRADFSLFEDFDGLVPGPIDGQNGWVAEDTSSMVVGDPIGGANQVLAVITESTHLYRSMLVPEGAARTLFLRFRFDVQLNYSAGLTDVAVPYRFDHFEVELSQTNSADELRINDAGTYDVLAELDPVTWYNCWVLIDAAADVSQVWLHARGLEDATAGDQLASAGQTIFAFRNSTANRDLINFYIKTGGGSGMQGPLYLDALYLEETGLLNLANPARTSSAAPRGSAPDRLCLTSSAGNPIAGQTILSFDLPAAGFVDLSVFDIGGRRVAGLLHGPAAAGHHEAAWHRPTAAGRPLTRGIYLVRLATEAEVTTTRLVVSR